MTELDAYLKEQAMLSLNETDRLEIINKYRVTLSGLSRNPSAMQEFEGGDNDEEAKEQPAASTSLPPLAG